MKVCIIKQLYDILGPQDSFLYNNITLEKLFDLYIAKYNGLESFLLFEADHYILNSYNFKRHECEVIKNNNLDKNVNFLEIYKKTLKKTYNENEIPFKNYDIVWCRDPILNNIEHYKKLYPNILFIYEEVEHERGYNEKSKFYDLILKHNIITKLDYNINCLPKTIMFLYPRSLKIYEYFKNIKKINENIYIDYRDIGYIKEKILNMSHSHSNMIYTYNFLKKKYNKFNILCNLKNSLNGICVSDIGKSDIKMYLELLAKSKYFISTYGRVGQSLTDAACLNCICFGTTKSVNHNILCHPFTLFNNFTDIDIIIDKINIINNNINLYNEIIDYQKKMLYKYYIEYPKKILENALNYKRVKQ